MPNRAPDPEIREILAAFRRDGFVVYPSGANKIYVRNDEGRRVMSLPRRAGAKKSMTKIRAEVKKLGVEI